MNRILEITLLNEYRLRLVYESDDTVEVDLRSLIDQGGVFSRLRDLESFRQVSIGQHGRFIEWPGGVDLCADALLERATSTA